MAPTPQRNYLTSLLIKSAYTAAHYNGRLIYSVYSKMSSVQPHLCLCLCPGSPHRWLVSSQAYKRYSLLHTTAPIWQAEQEWQWSCITRKRICSLGFLDLYATFSDLYFILFFYRIPWYKINRVQIHGKQMPPHLWFLCIVCHVCCVGGKGG